MLNLPSTWNAGIEAMYSRTAASETTTPSRPAASSSAFSSISSSSTRRLFSMLSNWRGSNASPCCWRASIRACSKRWRNSSPLTSWCSHSSETGQKPGAPFHHDGGALTWATLLAPMPPR